MTRLAASCLSVKAHFDGLKLNIMYHPQGITVDVMQHEIDIR